LEVDYDLRIRLLLRTLHEDLDLVGPQLHQKQTDLGAVVSKNVGKRRRDDRLEAIVFQRPRRVLTRRPATEGGPGNEHLRALVNGVIQDKRLVFAPGVE